MQPISYSILVLWILFSKRTKCKHLIQRFKVLGFCVQDYDSLAILPRLSLVLSIRDLVHTERFWILWQPMVREMYIQLSHNPVLFFFCFLILLLLLLFFFGRLRNWKVQMKVKKKLTPIQSYLICLALMLRPMHRRW